MIEIGSEEVEAAAGALGVHRWKSFSVSSVECECGEILHGDPSLISFPADEAFREHLAHAALTAARSSVTREQALDDANVEWLAWCAAYVAGEREAVTDDREIFIAGCLAAKGIEL